jgi:hypothetical protein
MVARQLSFAPASVEVVGVGRTNLWVSGQDGSLCVAPDGVVLARVDVWLADAFESQGSWYGVASDPRESRNARVCDLPQGRTLFELSGERRLPAGDRWFVDSTTINLDDSTAYIARELPSGRVTTRVEVPGTDHFLACCRDVLMVAGAGSDVLLEIPLGGGEARASTRWREAGIGAVSCLAADRDAVVVAAVMEDGSHCVLRATVADGVPRELLRLPADDRPTQLLCSQRHVLVVSDRGVRSVSHEGHARMVLEGEQGWVALAGERVLASPAGGRVRNPFAKQPPRPVLIFPIDARGPIEPLQLDTPDNLGAVGFLDGHVVFGGAGGGPVLVRLDALTAGEIHAPVVDCGAADGDLERAEVIDHSRDLLRLKTAQHPLLEALTSPMGLMSGDEVFVGLRERGRGRASVERLVVHKDGQATRRVSRDRGLDEVATEMRLGTISPWRAASKPRKG